MSDGVLEGFRGGGWCTHPICQNLQMAWMVGGWWGGIWWYRWWLNSKSFGPGTILRLLKWILLLSIVSGFKVTSSGHLVAATPNHRWELPVLHYQEIMVIYPFTFLVVITQFFSCIIFINDCIYIKWSTWIIFIHYRIYYTKNWR